MTEADYYPSECMKYKDRLALLEKAGQGNGKDATKIRSTLINIWNKCTPEQQKIIAVKYISD